MVSGTIGATLVEVRRALHAAAETPTWSLSDAEIVDALADVHALSAQVSDLTLRLVAQAERNDTATVGAASTKAMWANATRQTRPAAARRVALATALDERRSLTREAMARGEVSEEQAAVIVHAVDALPAEVEASVVEQAEKELITQAAFFDPRELKRLGDRVLEVVAPAVAEEQERRVLEREEARAAESVRLTMSDDGHGLVHGRFTLPAATGAMLRKAVLAHWHPGSGPGTGMGEAFRAYVERYPVDRLPDAGGVAATLVVTTSLSDLQHDLPATLDTGHRITAGETRRLACEAGIIPAVPRHPLRGPRHRTPDPPAHQGPTRRHRPAGQDVHRRGLRPPTRPVPRPPRPPLVRRRRNVRGQRPAALPQAPPDDPHHRLDHQPRRRRPPRLPTSVRVRSSSPRRPRARPSGG